MLDSDNVYEVISEYGVEVVHYIMFTKFPNMT